MQDSDWLIPLCVLFLSLLMSFYRPGDHSVNVKTFLTEITTSGLSAWNTGSSEHHVTWPTLLLDVWLFVFSHPGKWVSRFTWCFITPLQKKKKKQKQNLQHNRWIFYKTKSELQFLEPLGTKLDHWWTIHALSWNQRSDPNSRRDSVLSYPDFICM